MTWAIVNDLAFHLIIYGIIFTCGYKIGWIRAYRTGYEDHETEAHKRARNFPLDKQTRFSRN